MKNNFRDTIEEILDNSWEAKPLGQITNFRFENGKEVADIETVFNKEKSTDQIIEAFEKLVEECEPDELDTNHDGRIRLGHVMGSDEYRQNLLNSLKVKNEIKAGK